MFIKERLSDLVPGISNKNAGLIYACQNCGVISPWNVIGLIFGSWITAAGFGGNSIQSLFYERKICD